MKMVFMTRRRLGSQLLRMSNVTLLGSGQFVRAASVGSSFVSYLGVNSFGNYCDYFCQN